MTLVLDHVFVCAETGAPEADRLRALGFLEGSANEHPGQGTANRRFFFRNAMLELLWVMDPAEARSEGVARLGLWERWGGRASGACPFGICFRAADATPPPLPFATWTYHPQYAAVSIEVATNSTRADEPLLFFIPFHLRADEDRGWGREPVDHPNGARELERVVLRTPYAASVSAELRAAVAIEPSARFELELTLNNMTLTLPLG